MRRADRLFQLVQLIRGRRLSTAAWLATRLEVSERTVYRDVADLQRQGVPVEGEAGVGYRLGKGFDVPPLMFTRGEATALAAALRLAQAWLDPALAADAESAWSKVYSVLPPTARAAADSLPLFAPMLASDATTRATLDTLRLMREAIEEHRRVKVAYRDGAGAATERVLWPLGCFYWGSVWTVAAWCELRQDFRGFRVDRIADARVLPGTVSPAAGRTLADFLRSVRPP